VVTERLGIVLLGLLVICWAGEPTNYKPFGASWYFACVYRVPPLLGISGCGC